MDHARKALLVVSVLVAFDLLARCGQGSSVTTPPARGRGKEQRRPGARWLWPRRGIA